MNEVVEPYPIDLFDNKKWQSFSLMEIEIFENLINEKLCHFLFSKRSIGSAAQVAKTFLGVAFSVQL